MAGMAAGRGLHRRSGCDPLGRDGRGIFGGVYASATLGQLLREFTHGHALQLASVARAHLVNLVHRTAGCCRASRSGRSWTSIRCCARSTGTPSRAPATGTRRSPAGRCCARACPRWPPRSAPRRARRWSPGSGCAPGGPAPARARPRWSREAIGTARAAGATRARSWSAVTRPTATAPWSAPACKAGARFSVVLTKNAAVNRAIATIAEDAWTPVHYPGAVTDPDTGQLISDAEVAEVEFTAFASTDDAGHRAADRAPGPRPRQRTARRTVPGLALPPVLHQQPPNRSPTRTSPTASTRSSRPSSPT